LAIRDSIKEVLAKICWKIGPAKSSALLAEGHPRKFFLHPLPLGGIRRLSEPTHEQEEPFLLGFFGLQTGLDQIDKHPIGTCLPRFGQGTHAPGNPSRNRDALTNGSLWLSHGSYVTP
jgi:hypothetical protein